MTDLSNIPLDITLNIINKLDTIDIINLYKTNKHYYKIISDNNGYIFPNDILDINKLNNIDIVKIFPNIKLKYKYIFSNIEHINSDKYIKNIVDLNLSDFNYKITFELIEKINFSNIYSLTLKYCYIDYNIFEKININNLYKLELSGRYYTDRHFENIIFKNLDTLILISSNISNKSLKSFVNVKSLNLSFSDINDISCLINVNKLILEHCSITNIS